MTSTSSPAYPAEYYYPEFINSRPDNPILPPRKPPSLSGSISVARKIESRKKKLSHNVVTDHGLPEIDINKAVNTDPKKNLIRDPTENNIPKLIVNENIVKQVRFATIPNGYSNEDLSNKSRKSQDQTIKVVENGGWKKQVSIDNKLTVVDEVRFNY
jgi:hypothetical protein